MRNWFTNLEQEQHQREAVEKFQSELLSLASHELKNPLTSIRGYAHTLVREFGHLGEATQREFLEAIATESDRLSHLVSALLDMSQIEEGRLRVARRAVSPSPDLRRGRCTAPCTRSSSTPCAWKWRRICRRCSPTPTASTRCWPT